MKIAVSRGCLGVPGNHVICRKAVQDKADGAARKGEVRSRVLLTGRRKESGERYLKTRLETMAGGGGGVVEKVSARVRGRDG